MIGCLVPYDFLSLFRHLRQQHAYDAAPHDPAQKVLPIVKHPNNPVTAIVIEAFCAPPNACSVPKGVPFPEGCADSRPPFRYRFSGLFHNRTWTESIFHLDLRRCPATSFWQPAHLNLRPLFFSMLLALRGNRGHHHLLEDRPFGRYESPL